MLAILILPPVAFLLHGAFVIEAADGVWHPSLSSFAAVLARRGFGRSAANSLLFAAGSALLSAALGGCVAWLVERTNAPLKQLARVTTLLSLAMPYVLYTGSWIMLLGRAGPLNALVRWATGKAVFSAYALPSMIFVEGLLWSPLVVLMVGATLRRADPELEDAARVCGATARQVVVWVTLPLAMPSLLGAAVLVFMRSLEAFEVPALMGGPGRIRTVSIDIYDSVQSIPPDLGTASSLATALLAILGVLLFGYSRLTRGGGRFATIAGPALQPRRSELGRWRWTAATVMLMYFAALLALPLLMLLWASLLPFYQPPGWAGLGLATLQNFVNVSDPVHYGIPVANTLAVAALSATIVMLLGALTGWLRAWRAPAAAILDVLGTAPLVLPGVVLAVAVIQLFLRLPTGFYGTIGMLAWAFVISTMPYGIRYGAAAMLHLHSNLEHASMMAGAGPVARLRRIVFPLVSPSLIAGWVFVFLSCGRALSLPVLLSGPSSQTIAVVMFDMLSNGQMPELAALGLLWSFGMALLALAVQGRLA